jgi:hypothetical protein
MNDPLVDGHKNRTSSQGMQGLTGKSIADHWKLHVMVDELGRQDVGIWRWLTELRFGV